MERNQRNSILRRRREAIEEMRRNGVVIWPKWAGEVYHPQPDLPGLNISDIGVEDFVSLAGARPMANDDIANVLLLSVDELQETLAEVAKRLGRR